MVRGDRPRFGAAAIAAAVMMTTLGCEPRASEIQREQASARATDRFAVGVAAYAKYCALCHGPNAEGYAADHAPSLVSSTFLESASDEQIARGIREGRPGTAMAPYGKVRGGPLEEDEIAALVAFFRSRDPIRVSLPSTPILGDAAAGEAIYDSSCKRCHGTRTDRGDAVHLGNVQLLAGSTDAFLRYAIVHGRPGTPMPAFGDTLSDAQIDNVVTMLRSWASPPPAPFRAPPEPPPLGEVVINPSGKAPEFTLREDRYVPIADVKRALEEKKRIVIIDARAPSDWYMMHIPGSISIPYYAFARIDALPKDGTWITAYCACPHHASGAVVDELRRRGFTHTAVLDEGILEWKKRDYPTASETPPESAATPANSTNSTPARPANPKQK